MRPFLPGVGQVARDCGTDLARGLTPVAFMYLALDRHGPDFPNEMMPQDTDAGRPLDFIVLTCRPASSDFRFHLARELSGLGHRVTYIFLKRRPTVTDLETGQAQQWSLGKLVAYFVGLRRRSPAPIVFNSTNLAFPLMSVGLRLLSGTRWCLDMHDDLLYGSKGVRRFRMAALQALLVSQSDLIVHAAPTLKTLFPRSRHVGNGSSLTRLSKTREDPRRILIMASLDERFDFALMRQAAERCPERSFEVYGRISQNDPAVARALDALLAEVPNVSYHGPYSDPELPDLLARYLVAFAPYKVGDRLTDYIDPLRFYHCLASGTGLVSTAIPQALAMRDRIEVLENLDQLDAALARAAQQRGGPVRTWRQVAERVAELVRT